MLIWILERIEQATDNYHPRGGVVVIAHDEAEARQLVEAEGATPTDEEWGAAIVYAVEAHTPRVWIMPDAGCC